MALDSPAQPAYRHDPTKSVLVGSARAEAFAWEREPAVCGYRKLKFESALRNEPIAVPVSASPAVVSGVGVVVASDDGHVRFLDASLARQYWQLRLSSAVYASLVVDSARRRVVVAGTNGTVVCIDLHGNVAWSARTGVAIYATPTVMPESDLVVIAGFEGWCLALDLDRGVERYRTAVPRPWHARFGGVAAHRDPYASPVCTDRGTAIHCCAEHALCLAADGRELWRIEVGAAVKASPVFVAATGEAVICTMDGRCIFVECESGARVREIALGTKLTSSAALSGGVLAVGGQHNRAFGVDARAREIVWSSEAGAPVSYTSFTVLPDGSFIATAEGGNIVCLRARDGAFRWESSQVLGLPDHEPAMHITPTAAPDGNMYCASYEGDLYRFKFRPLAQEWENGDR